MKLKTKLIMAFCSIILIPILLAFLVMAGFRNFQLKEIEQSYGLESGSYEYMPNSVQLLNRYTAELYDEIKQTAQENPKELENQSYLDEINVQLRDKYSFLVVREGEDFIYVGTKDAEEIPEVLPEYDGTDASESEGFWMDAEKQALVKQIDFTDTEQQQCSAFIITSTKALVPEMKEMVIDMSFSVVLILILTASILTIWIYSSIIIPIKKLKAAARNIKEGNLDFVVDVDGKDEIGELGQSFEEMRQRLKESMEEKMSNEAENRSLISNIAHDLKTPITAVKGYSEGIMDGVADTPEKRDKYIRTIYNKATEMETLINELTLYANIETNRIPYNFNKLNVADYFNDCVEELSLELEAKGIGLSYYNYAENDVLMIADPEQLRRIIHNIVNNSVKYLDKKPGFINIRVKDVGDFIQVEIEDNGKGIAQKDLPYIFERFFRADASRNSATGGSGIGLSIVKKIIEDHGGKIWATSKEGTGTIMYFVLRKYQEVPNE